MAKLALMVRPYSSKRGLSNCMLVQYEKSISHVRVHVKDGSDKTHLFRCTVLLNNFGYMYLIQNSLAITDKLFFPTANLSNSREKDRMMSGF